MTAIFCVTSLPFQCPKGTVQLYSMQPSRMHLPWDTMPSTNRWLDRTKSPFLDMATSVGNFGFASRFISIICVPFSVLPNFNSLDLLHFWIDAVRDRFWCNAVRILYYLFMPYLYLRKQPFIHALRRRWTRIQMLNRTTLIDDNISLLDHIIDLYRHKYKFGRKHILFFPTRNFRSHTKIRQSRSEHRSKWLAAEIMPILFSITSSIRE